MPSPARIRRSSASMRSASRAALVIVAEQMQDAVDGQMRVMIAQRLALFGRFARDHGAQITRSPSSRRFRVARGSYGRKLTARSLRSPCRDTARLSARPASSSNRTMLTCRRRCARAAQGGSPDPALERPRRAAGTTAWPPRLGTSTNDASYAARRLRGSLAISASGFALAVSGFACTSHTRARCAAPADGARRPWR